MASGPLLFHKPIDQAARYLPPRPNFVAPAKSVKTRRRLWDFSAHLHCSIIGTCLTTGELRKILLKALGEHVHQLSDHDIHKEGVRLSNAQGAAAKLLNRTLDERHASSIRRFGAARSSGDVLECWRSARSEGDIPGGYWAALSHPELLETHLAEIFGDVHMLSHLVGAANRADVRRLAELERINDALLDKVERQQSRLYEVSLERDAFARQIESFASRARADCARVRQTTEPNLALDFERLNRAGKILERVRKITVGNPLDPSTNMGPINNKAQYQKVLSYIALGKEQGATLLTGGGKCKGAEFEKGYWIEPTVFGDVTVDMRIAREEIFGPVMSIFKFRTESEAISMANAIDLGLTAAVWTQDISRALRVSRAIDAGYVWINGVGTHFTGVPYGGFKNSGVGREEGLGELLSYTEEKVINLCNGAIRGE